MVQSVCVQLPEGNILGIASEIVLKCGVTATARFLKEKSTILMPLRHYQIIVVITEVRNNQQ